MEMMIILAATQTPLSLHKETQLILDDHRSSKYICI